MGASPTWQRITTMDRARSHTPVAVVGDELYIFGGGGVNFSSQNACAAFNAKTRAWRRLQNMPTARSGTIACVVDEKIYIVGGGFKQPDGMFRFLPTVEIYDPNSDSWTQGPDMLAPHDYPGGLYHEGFIYIFGGHHPDATKAGPKTDPGFDFCERLNVNSGKWEQLAPLPTPRFALNAVAHQGRLLTMGGVAFTPEGFNNFDMIEQYDPATNKWTKRGDISLPWTAAGQSNCVFKDKLYIFGGYSGDGIHPRAAALDPRSNQWQRLPDMPAPRCATGLGIVNNTVYLFGGWADDGRTPQDSVFALDLS